MTSEHPSGPTTIKTFTGRSIDLLHPRVDDIDIADISHGLSHVCRFGGQAIRWASVAGHSVLVWKLVCDATDDAELRIGALFHDAHESYLGDTIKPMKLALRVLARELDSDAIAPIDTLEAKFDAAIADRIGIGANMFKHPIVRAADEHALLYEASRNHRWDWNGKERPKLPAGVRWMQFLPPMLAERQFRIAYREASRLLDRQRTRETAR